MNIKPKYVKGDTVFYIDQYSFYPVPGHNVIKGTVEGFNYSSNDKPHFSYLINFKIEEDIVLGYYSQRKKETELFDSKEEATSKIPITPIALIKKNISIVEKKMKKNKDTRKAELKLLKKALKDSIKNEKI